MANNPIVEPGTMLYNPRGFVGWVVSQMPNPFIFLVEWNYGGTFYTSSGKVLEDHQRLLDYERAKHL